MAITPTDEFLCHQSVATFDRIPNTDSQWTERVWFSAFEKTGALQVVFGLGKYHNRNVMDASIGVVFDGAVQHDVRVSRELIPAVDDYRVGPIGYTIPEPLRVVRITTDANDSGVACDLRFIGQSDPYLQDPQMFRMRKGRVVNHMMRYFQTGSVEGWVERDGERIAVRPDDWWASRDRSWGIRANTGEATSADGENQSLLGGLEPAGEGIPFHWNFFTMQFDGWNTSFEFAESPEGQRLGPALGHVQYADPDRPDDKIVHVDHEWDFEEGRRRLRGIRSVVHLEGGETRELRMEPVSIAYRRPGGGHYGGYGRFVQGRWLGELDVETDRLELTDAVRDDLHFVDDYALRVTWGDEVGWGIAEPLIPGVTELLTT